MRVLFNTYPMAFDVPGGGEMQLMAYRKYLPNYGVEPVLFDLWNPQFDEFDLVHFFSVVGGSSHFCAHIKKRGLPLFVSSSLWITDETKHLYPIDEIGCQLELADRIVTNSNAESAKLSSVFGLPKEKFIAVHNGIDEKFIQLANAKSFSSCVPESQKFFLNVGNIEPRKNQLSLIQAMKKFPDYKLVLIGFVRDQVYARKCFELGGDKLIFLGSMPHNSELLRAAMAASEIFIMPSILETPSLAALEAAAQGAKIVITEVGSTREYFGDMAHYINPNDVDSICDAIESALLKNKDKVLHSHIVSSFTWNKVIGRLDEEYRKFMT